MRTVTRWKLLSEREREREGRRKRERRGREKRGKRDFPVRNIIGKVN